MINRRTGVAVLAAVGAVVPALPLSPTAAVGTGTPSIGVVQRRVVGHSVEGRPIWAVERGNPDASRRVVVVGQIHGDERAGVRTARYIVQHVPVSSGTDLWVVPTMNPDGLALNTRQNSRGVDLNRNWPMNWHRGPQGTTYPGPRAASEPETRAMLAFLKQVQPRFLVSLHQPFGEVGKDPDKPIPFQRRLARQLQLPLRKIDIAGPTRTSHQKGLQPGGADNAPTLTGWYNAHYPGSAITVELPAHPSRSYVTWVAGRGILRASWALG